MKLWIVYCALKNEKIKRQKERLNIDFDLAIKEIESQDFLKVSSPGRSHRGEEAFIIVIYDYPIVVPFNTRGQVIQLITMFPDRRFKNVRFRKS